jgi:hypothetical protein
MTPHPSPFRSPIALPSYHPNPTHDSSAPRRQLDGGLSPAADGRGGSQAVRSSVVPSKSLLLSGPVGAHPDGICPAERPADIQRSGVVAVVDTARTPAMASVASRCPASVSTHPGSSSGLRRSSRPVSSRPVSGHLGSSSGCPAVWSSAVHPSGVHPVGCPALWCPPVQPPAGWCPPRRSGRVVSSHAGRWRWAQVGAAGTCHHGNGSSPGRLPHRRAARSTAEQARTRRCCRARALVSGVGGGPGPAAVPAAACPLSDQAGQAGVRSAVANGGNVGLGAGSGARLPHLPRGCRPRAGRATTVGGGRGPCRPGGRARKGRWACWRGWACGPSAAQAGSGRSRLAAGSAVTCGTGWWACQDLNLGPHPYQQSSTERHADRCFPW